MNANLHIKPLFIIIVACCISSVSFAQQPVLKHSYTFNDGTAKDSIGNADGLLKGGKIEAGKYITSEQGQYIELPAKLIKINSYTSLSLEAYIIAGKANAINTMLSFFGNKTERWGTDFIFLSAKNAGYGLSAISCKNNSMPWTTSTDARCNALDDGLPHHIVTTFNNKVLKLYADGLLVDSTTNEEFPDNLLGNIGEQVAYLAKSGYMADPTWLGTIDVFNIYEGILDAETIEKSAQKYVPKQVLAARNQLTDLVPSEGVITQTMLDTMQFGLSLNKDWTFHSGDDLTWSEKDFDDSSWLNLVNYTMTVDNVNGKPWEGIAWFRRKIKIDSALYNKAVGISMYQLAASEIYLNGKLIRRNGQIGSDTIREKLYNPQFIPFIGVFDTTSIQVIAIRYSNQKALQNFKRYGNSAKYISFSFRIGTDKFIDQSIERSISSATSLTTFITFFLAFTLLNLLMFFFYSKGKENFYFALFTGSATLIFGYIAYLNIVTQISAISYLLDIVIVMVIPVLFSSYVFFLYMVFFKKMPRQFWPIVFIGILTSLVSGILFRSGFNFTYLLVSFVFILTLEGLRVTITAIVRKQRNAVVIGAGVAIFSISTVIVTYAILYSRGITNNIVSILVFIGVVSLPLSMLIYLARERAKTKSDLETRIVEVQELSAKAVEQEKREAELRVENTRKEVELQNAAELKSAYHNLEVAHENLKSTQSQLIQSEKMASLGALTAGIAHEIQNPLNFVNNFSEVSKELIGEMNEELAVGNWQLAKEIAGDIEQNLEKINHHGKRAESIVKGMLLHSRGNSGHKELVDINALCDEFLRLSFHGFRAKDKSFSAEYKTEFDPNLPKINVVPQDIGRVLLNLINNAFYAVQAPHKAPPPPEGGIKESPNNYKPLVIVSTASSKSPSGDLGVKVVVKDNGSGIPLEIKDKIFQPFFTTKPTGQGTGLGLSLAYDIVKAHGGELKVETEEGVGTEFIITLLIT
jgi:two-component system, NtrC family, sensor kinase